MLKQALFAMLVIQAAPVLAGDLSGIAGHYNYAGYTVTLADGRQLGLGDLGATRAALDIDKSSIELIMLMANGKVMRERARVLSAEIGASSGHWIAQWPEMSYPVRADFTYTRDTVDYTTRFQDPSDPQRYGSAEHAHLERTKN
jgi:hypothetical protein